VKKLGFSSNVTIDYNPSRCADFFRTGYCGFGNSCIFAHVRGDYQFGWEQENEWEKKLK
jgi:RING finger protein 113A